MLRHEAALASSKLTRGSPGGQLTNRKSLCLGLQVRIIVVIILYPFILQKAGKGKQEVWLQSVYVGPMLRGKIRQTAKEDNDALTISRDGSLPGRLLVA